jgi:hypothetical protein
LREATTGRPPVAKQVQHGIEMPVLIAVYAAVVKTPRRG